MKGNRGVRHSEAEDRHVGGWRAGCASFFGCGIISNLGNCCCIVLIFRLALLHFFIGLIFTAYAGVKLKNYSQIHTGQLVNSVVGQRQRGKSSPPPQAFARSSFFSFPFPLAGHPPSLSTSPSYSPLHIPSY